MLYKFYIWTLFNFIWNVFITEIFSLIFFLSKYITIFFDRMTYIYFLRSSVWFLTLEILRVLRWNSSSFRLRTKHFRAFYMDVTTFTSQKLELRHDTAFFSRASAKRKRETELRVQIELGIRVRGNFHENIFEIEAENSASISVDI